MELGKPADDRFDEGAYGYQCKAKRWDGVSSARTRQVEPRCSDDILDELFELTQILGDLRHVTLGDGRESVRGKLAHDTNSRQGRAKLVRDVGEQLFFSAPEGLDAVRHLVECLRQVTNLAAPL